MNPVVEAIAKLLEADIQKKVDSGRYSWKTIHTYRQHNHRVVQILNGGPSPKVFDPKTWFEQQEGKGA